jgi:hypothetical protein
MVSAIEQTKSYLILHVKPISDLKGEKSRLPRFDGIVDHRLLCHAPEIRVEANIRM